VTERRVGQLSDKMDAEIRQALADPMLNRMLDEQYVNLPDPPEPPPINYDAMSLAQLLDDFERVAMGYYYDTSEDEIYAARARVDERLKQAGLL
jgi:hypothetical protein